MCTEELGLVIIAEEGRKGYRMQRGPQHIQFYQQVLRFQVDLVSWMFIVHCTFLYAEMFHRYLIKIIRNIPQKGKRKANYQRIPRRLVRNKVFTFYQVNKNDH